MTTLPKGYRVLAGCVFKRYAPSRAIIRNKIQSNSTFNLDILQLIYLDSQNLFSPDMVIWKALNRLLNELRHSLTIQTIRFICVQRLMWRLTIALWTFNWRITSWLTPQRLIRTYCILPMSINQTHHAKAKTVLTDRGVPKLFHPTTDWLEIPLHRILAIVCLTRQSHIVQWMRLVLLSLIQWMLQEITGISKSWLLVTSQGYCIIKSVPLYRNFRWIRWQRGSLAIKSTRGFP